MWENYTGLGFINIDGSQQPANADKDCGKITGPAFCLTTSVYFKRSIYAIGYTSISYSFAHLRYINDVHGKMNSQ